jgi:ERCC4-type nuclease
MRIVIDTREQKAWQFPADFETVRKCLKTGDLSLENYETDVCIERKELNDFIACCGFERARFKAELERMTKIKARCVVIEGNFSDIVNHCYRSQIAPQAVIATIASWTQRFQTAFILAGDRAGAARFALAFLKNFESQLTEKE